MYELLSSTVRNTVGTLICLMFTLTVGQNGLCRLAEHTATGLRIPDGQTLLFIARAKGVQIYLAKKEEKGRQSLKWVLEGPRATLYDAADHLIGRHEKGPTWIASDGSQITGTVVSKAPGSAPHDIPWLLLSAKAGTGTGQMSGVTYVMRVDTNGGMPPLKPPIKIGARLSVPYRAIYLFLSAAGSAPQDRIMK